jgi:hypothetical protein
VLDPLGGGLGGYLGGWAAGEVVAQDGTGGEEAQPADELVRG